MTATTIEPPTPDIPRSGVVGGLVDAWVIMGRNLRFYARQPQIAVFVIIQPVMFVLLFRYVFGGSIPTPGVDYVQYLMPGIIVQSIAFSVVGTGVGIAQDLKAGMMDRFRSLPMARSAVLGGRVLADTAVSLVTLVVMLAVAYLVGFRITTSAVQAVAALLLLLAFTMSFAWVAAWIGLTLREPEAVQSAGFVWLFPVAFASSIFVLPATMPSWLQAFATHNPLSRLANAARSLTIGGYPCGPTLEQTTLCTGVAEDALWSLAWAGALVSIFLPLSARGWQRLD
ncbi:ABC transporter permease [Euzebya tangerina]|uniref:ABC transporter permease n=1 Tax=Euzebya tangerina TaxID=591198 RepID=UPI00196A5F53|nr:ABC transporter permease [Euzebya tangerina]